MELKDIEQHIAPLLSHFHSACNTLSGSDIPVIEHINQHLQEHTGKQLRPILTLLSAACSGLPLTIENEHPVFSLCAAIELLHNATLIHDDVVDQSDTRRGKPTVNNQWGNKTAVLVGDYYLAQVMLTLNTVNIDPVTRVINQAVVEMTEGELLQQQCCSHFDIDEALYNRIIYKKTACFMSACCEIGVLVAAPDSPLLPMARQYGEHIGMAFQLRDDLRDCLPTHLTGKPQGNDLLEHKATLPLILALQQADTNTRKETLTLLDKQELNESDIQHLTHIIVNETVVQQCRNRIQNHLALALQAVEAFPANSFRDDLAALTRILQDS